VTWPFSYDPPDRRRLDPWVALKPGQVLQGALLHPRLHDPCVYIVTIPPPTQYAEIASPWPRILEGH